tara:strand:+ start:4637 stop:5338 length:702 start_codon:yes stop_codon:yes gene_type:complete
MIISLEGNIGSGKSTLFNYIKEQIESPNIIFLREPVDMWESIKDENGNLLEHFYNDPYKYSYCFQMTAYISRLIMLKDALKSLGPDGTIITERCVFSDFNVFAKMLYSSGKINKIELESYKMWFDHFIQDIQTPVFVYLRSTPETCFKRVLNRARSSEMGISLEYLRECEEYHDAWLMPGLTGNVTILDGNQSTDYHSKHLNVIKKLIHNPRARSHKRKVSFLEDTLSSFNFI